MEVFFYLNDNMIEVDALKNEVTEAFVNNATVTARVKDLADVEITGQTWPLTLDYIAASDGVYRGVLDSTLDVDIGDKISVEVTVTATGGLDAFWRIPTIVRQRGKVYA